MFLNSFAILLSGWRIKWKWIFWDLLTLNSLLKNKYYFINFTSLANSSISLKINASMLVFVRLAAMIKEQQYKSYVIIGAKDWANPVILILAIVSHLSNKYKLITHVLHQLLWCFVQVAFRRMCKKIFDPSKNARF